MIPKEYRAIVYGFFACSLLVGVLVYAGTGSLLGTPIFAALAAVILHIRYRLSGARNG